MRHEQFVGVSGVYAFAGVGTFAVKIGWSTNIAKRFGELLVACPFGLEVAGVIRTDNPATEREVHRYLSNWSLRGEWFVWCDEVRECIDKFFDADSQEPERGRLNSLISQNPLLLHDEIDEATTAVLRAMNRPGGRHLLAALTENERLVTCEDLVRLVSQEWGSHKELCLYRKRLQSLAYFIQKTGPSNQTGLAIAQGIREVFE